MIGRNILHYHIEEKLGEGGMGIVYKALDTKLKRYVAIKFLPHHIAHNTEERLRFEKEAQAAASLNHSNITQIYAFEEENGNAFISMELINGIELKEKIKETKLSVDEIISISIKIAEGLKEAHHKGIIHRDIKSSNIMITDKGDLKIMDFGLAEIDGDMNLSLVGSTVGTAAYMSPEQAQNEEIDERTDIWSLGIVIYEMAAGKPPFSGNYEQAVIYSLINQEPAPISEARSDIPADLSSIINKCLKKNKDERYNNSDELLEDLQNLKSGGKLSSHEVARENLSDSKIKNRRNRTLVYSSTVIVLAIIIGFLSKDFIYDLVGMNLINDNKHLVVLPLNNISGNQLNQAFCDGLVETLTSSLSKLGNFDQSLWVVPSSEVRRDKIETASDAYKSYGANLAVTGSVQMLDNVVRLTLNLIDAVNLRQINSLVIDVPEKKLVELQDNSVSEFLTMLNLELKESDREKISSAGTSESEAYDSFLQGKGYLLRYENVENLDLAIKLFRQAISEDSTFAHAYAGLGEAYWLKYENSKDVSLVDSALRVTQKAISLDAQLASVKITMGTIKIGTGHYDDALKLFEASLEIEPRNAEALRGLAKTFEAKNMLDKAETTFKEAIKLKPDYWAGYNDLGVFYYRHNRFNDAIEQFQKIINLTPDNYRGYSNLGGIYYTLERMSEAKKMFEKSLSLKKSYRAASNLGTLYYLERNFKDAAKTYKLALEFNDHDYIVWGNLAMAYYYISDTQTKSIAIFKKAIDMANDRLKINPNDPNAIAQLAGYYSMIKDEEKTKEMISRSLTLAPDDASVLYRVGAAYEQLGNRESAIKYILKAIEKGHPKAEILNQYELRNLIKDKFFIDKLNLTKE